METSETPLEQTQRHVKEGKDRIAKQQALIAELAHDGHDGMLPAAQELLAQLNASQQLGREHLEREQTKKSDQR